MGARCRVRHFAGCDHGPRTAGRARPNPSQPLRPSLLPALGRKVSRVYLVVRRALSWVRVERWRGGQVVDRRAGRGRVRTAHARPRSAPLPPPPPFFHPLKHNHIQGSGRWRRRHPQSPRASRARRRAPCREARHPRVAAVGAAAWGRVWGGGVGATAGGVVCGRRLAGRRQGKRTAGERNQRQGLLTVSGAGRSDGAQGVPAPTCSQPPLTAPPPACPFLPNPEPTWPGCWAAVLWKAIWGRPTGLPSCRSPALEPTLRGAAAAASPPPAFPNPHASGSCPLLPHVHHRPPAAPCPSRALPPSGRAPVPRWV